MGNSKIPPKWRKIFDCPPPPPPPPTPPRARGEDTPRALGPARTTFRTPAPPTPRTPGEARNLLGSLNLVAMDSPPPPSFNMRCSAARKNTELCGDDHAPVTRGRMRAQYPLPHGPFNMGAALDSPALSGTATTNQCSIEDSRCVTPQRDVASDSATESCSTPG